LIIMTDKETTLQKIGLPKNEAKVYVSLLKLESASVGQITKISGIHRRNVYDVLERLVNKGLVSYVTKEKVKYFEAADPYFLLSILEREKEKLKNNKNDLSPLLSELLQIKKVSSSKDSLVVIYKGVNGIKTVLEDVLNSKKENLVLGAHRPPEVMRNYLERFHERRAKLAVKEKLLFNKNDAKRAKKLSQHSFTKVKFLPKKSNGQTAINIYGDKVAILMWSDPVGILIKNADVAKTFREYFKLLWKNGK
jgi:HTH-type transcriptional regulator, sugar sensing transcriptional regulator